MQTTRTKTILSIIAVILAVAVFYILFFVQQWENSQQLILQGKKDQVSSLVQTMTRELDSQYSARIKSFARQHENIVRLFAERKREDLYQAMGQIYETLKSENKYFDHINFVLPDSTIFLRMHEPDQHGDKEQFTCNVYFDTEDRPTEGVSGFVFGDCGLLYRVIEPLYHEGTYVGNILFGVGMEVYIGELRDELNMHTALAIRKEILGDAEVDSRIESVSEDYVILDYDDPFFHEQSGKISLTGKEQQYKHENAIHYVFPSYIIKDNEGQEIGRILQGLDLTEAVETYRNDIIRLVFITIAVIVVSSYILYFAFNKMIGEMSRLNRQLEEKNEELLQAGQELEQQVLKRTSELGEANTQLIKEIEERHEANLSLIQSIEEWQSTFDAIADPVTILDRDLEVVIANKSAQEMLRHDDREIVGRNCYELFAGNNEPCDMCPAIDVFTTGVKKEYEIEHDHLGKHLLVSCSPIYDNNEITGFVHTAKDITEQKILKKQLSQAQKMEAIATLAGGIAHDFNNILGAILGNADLLLYRLATPAGMAANQNQQQISPEDIATHIEAIKKAGNRAKELVSQILAFSRQSKTQRQDVLIIPVIKEGVKLLKSSLAANIEVKSSIDQDACHINADLGQIHQVFMNLCTNAAQAMSEKGGVLEVTLQNFEAESDTRKEYPEVKPGSYLALSVRDTGHGMSRDIMERIFDPFFTTRDVGEGTGMGLSVIHGIINAHRGVLDVKSEIDVGSVFTAFFPCVGKGKETAEDPVLGVPRGTENILFVDDEKDIVKMSTSMLEYLGYTVLPAHSGEEALEKLRAQGDKVDLIICDYSMPGMSGTDLAAEVLELERKIPVILCSGFSESVVLDDQSKKIIRKFMSKPLDMKKLAIAIREVLSR